MIERLVLLGATGDLAGRLIFPALAALRANGEIDELRVVGAAPEDLDDDSFRQCIEQQLERHASDIDRAARGELLRSLTYVRIDLDERAGLGRAIDEDPTCVYLALPPRLFPKAVDVLSAARLPRGSRVAVEKPIGDDLAGAVSLNEALERLDGALGKGTVFRVDHVLGMPTIGNLLGIRLAHPRFEPLWSSEHIEQINVLWEETIALEGRSGFYDRVGALKDVGQNHMLQLLSMVAMEPPASLNADELAARKIEALRAIKPMNEEHVRADTRRARYGPGRLANTGGATGDEVPAYADEDGVQPSRGTETFMEVSLELDTERWSGTRFVLRAGKALRERRKGVEVLFRASAGLDPDGGRALLWIGVDGPTNVALRGRNGEIEPPPEAPPVSLAGGTPGDRELPPYAHVLRDILGGASNLAVRGDEAEEAWRVLTPVIDGWSRGLAPLEEYPAGSAGPR